MNNLTVSGNEVTDASRALALTLPVTASGQMCDGRGYVLVTNKLPNGGFETDVAGLSTFLGATWVQDSTHVKFGGQASKLTTPGASAGEGTNAGAPWRAATAPGNVETISMYVYSTAGGEVMRFSAQVRDTGGVLLQSFPENPTTLVAGWQRLVITVTMPANAATIEPMIRTANTPQAITVWLDGVQVEQGSVAHDYVDTNGAPATAIQGAGDSSFGIRRAATNLFPHGQCDSLGSGPQKWNTSTGGAASFLDLTTPALFSPWSVKYVFDGTQATQSAAPRTGTGLAAAAGTSGVGSVWCKLVAGNTYTANMRWGNTDGTSNDGGNTGVWTARTGRWFTYTNPATGDAWELVIPPAVTVATGKTGDYLQIIVRVPAGVTRAETVWLAHAMLEKGQAVVAPYVATSGGVTATHAAALVQAPALVGVDLGWLVVRARLGRDGSTGDMAFLEACDGTSSNRYSVIWQTAGASWELANVSGGVGAFPRVTVGAAPAAGDMKTVILAWDAANLYLSVDGSPFVSTAKSHTPAALTTVFVGSLGTSRWIDGDVIWFACGTGTLTDADAATLNALGNTDPTMGTLGPSTRTTMVWTADTVEYNEGFEDSGETFAGVSTLGVGAPSVLYTGAGAFDGDAELSGSGVTLYSGGGNLLGTSTLAGAGGALFTGGGVFTGEGKFRQVSRSSPRRTGRVALPTTGRAAGARVGAISTDQPWEA